MPASSRFRNTAPKETTMELTICRPMPADTKASAKLCHWGVFGREKGLWKYSALVFSAVTKSQRRGKMV